MTRYATLSNPTVAIGPDGHGTEIPAGRDEIADLDGVPAEVLYLYDQQDPGKLIGCIQATDADITKEQP